MTSPGGAPRASVLVVEDDARLAATIRRALAYEGLAVSVAPDGAAGLEALRRNAFDLVVLDRMLPGPDGLEICRRLREAGDTTAVLMVTARDAVADRVAGLDAGADDYLVKPFAHEELLARVRALLRRVPAQAGLLRFADVEVDPAGMTARRAGRPLDLTVQEFRLLEHLVRHPRVVLPRDRILDAVWGMEARSASNVVDVYVGYLRRKLEADGGARLVHAVRGIGYVLRDPA
jgi:two-component system, OmpR family, response regulator MprA